MSGSSSGGTPSRARTLRVLVRRPVRGLTDAQLPLVWISKEPDEQLDFSLDLSDWLEDAGDMLAQVTADIKPSGAGEAVLQSVTNAAGLVTFWVAGGVAGRSYMVRVIGTTAAGRILEQLPVLPIATEFAVTPIAPPPSPDFGTPVHWQSARLDFSKPANSAYFLLLF